MDEQSIRPGFVATTAGLLSGLLSAAVTALLLLINGSLVLVLLGSFASTAPAWLVREGFLQFILFSVPLVLVALEWMIWDAFHNLIIRDI